MTKLLASAHYFYLVLALLGGGITFYFVLLGMDMHQGHFDSMEFITSTWVENAYAKSLTCDFWTGAITGTFFVLVEGIRLKMKWVVLYIAAIILIGFAFGFPFFLFMRSVWLKKQNQVQLP